jgi:hypothetical protein
LKFKRFKKSRLYYRTYFKKTIRYRKRKSFRGIKVIRYRKRKSFRGIKVIKILYKKIQFISRKIKQDGNSKVIITQVLFNLYQYIEKMDILYIKWFKKIRIKQKILILRQRKLLNLKKRNHKNF